MPSYDSTLGYRLNSLSPVGSCGHAAFLRYWEISGPVVPLLPGGSKPANHGILTGRTVKPIIVIGQRLGGAVAMLLALVHPKDVAGLVMLDPLPVNDVTLAGQGGADGFGDRDAFESASPQPMTAGVAA